MSTHKALNNHNYVPIPEDELFKRRQARDRKERLRAIGTAFVRKVGRWSAVGAGVAVVGIGGNYFLNKNNHIKSDDTLAALKADLGHVPKGIISIEPTDDPEIRDVHYIVQNRPQDLFVSAVAADLHPVAPNQNPQEEFAAIDTYLDTPGRVYPNQPLDIKVNTVSGQILDNPEHSVEK